jgi:hypothetical protein
MPSKKSTELTHSQDSLPRRRAIQGVAGSLAGIAALGALSASGKKKNKKKGAKGTLVRIEVAEETDSIPANSTDTITATCPAVGNKEEVFAIGGGFDVSTSPNVDDFIIRASEATNNLQGWAVTFANTDVTEHDATTTVICAYFKSK